MPTNKQTIQAECHCLRCGDKFKDDGYKWRPRVAGRPCQCPRCKSPIWDKRRKNK